MVPVGSCDFFLGEAMKKQITVPSEIMYLLATVLMAISVCMCTAADFGVSMIVAPAYIISLKFTFLTFGQSEYLVQALFFIVFCILMRKVRIPYFFSFLSCLFYGAVLDLFRAIIPLFNPDITAPGSMHLAIRILLFVSGMVITSFAVALFMHTYLYPQVYDFFVKGIAWRYKLNFTKFKTIFDFSFLAVSVLLSLLFFHGIQGIGIGTLVLALLNGFLIGTFSKWMQKHMIFKALFPKLEKHFILS